MGNINQFGQNPAAFTNDQRRAYMQQQENLYAE
jgi:hypothetical protein